MTDVEGQGLGDKLRVGRKLMDAFLSFDPGGSKVLGFLDWLRKLSQSEGLGAILSGLRDVLELAGVTGAFKDFVDLLLSWTQPEAASIDALSQEDVQAIVDEYAAMPRAAADAQAIDWTKIMNAIILALQLFGKFKS